MKAQMTQTKNGNWHNGYFAEAINRRTSIEGLLNTILFDDCFISEKEDDWEKSECPYRNANDFLHGSCDIFSVVLNNIYGYSVYEVVGENGTSIHWFTIKKVHGRTFYIDVRGATTDKEEFFSEYKGAMNSSFTIEQRTGDELVVLDRWAETGRMFAHYIISLSNGIYEI